MGKSKVHLKSSSEPLADGSDQLVACGLKLPKAKSVSMIDAGFWGGEGMTMTFEVDSRGRLCEDCYLAFCNPGNGGPKAERYTYALVTSQEALDNERGT